MSQLNYRERNDLGSKGKVVTVWIRERKVWGVWRKVVEVENEGFKLIWKFK